MSNDRTALIDTQGTMAYPLDPGLAAAAEQCPACESQIPAAEQFCPRCGYQRGTWQANSAAAATAGASAPALAGGASSLAATAAGWAATDSSPFWLESSGGERIGLPVGECVVGRGEVDIRLNDNFASRRHAQFSVSVEDVRVEDLGSSNGTFIEGAQLAAGTPMLLTDGEELKIGGTVFMLRRNPAFGAGEATTIVINEPSPVAASDPALADVLSGAAPDPDAGAEETAAEESAHDEAEGTAMHSPWSLCQSDAEPILLPFGITTVGRKAEKADVVLGDGYISSLHGQFEAGVDELIFTDLGSTNGSMLDDEKLQPNSPRELSSGDVLTLGQTQLVIGREG